LSVAIAMVSAPEVMFLDEPSAGLDPDARRFLWKIILSNSANQATILTSHSLDEVETLSTKVGCAY
jgi:ABC-2 type transport system ATP-binding protein